MDKIIKMTVSIDFIKLISTLLRIIEISETRTVRELHKMLYYLLKLIISSVLIIAISEIGKRSSFFGGILASIPLTSFLAFIWMYSENKDVKPIIELSKDIFWLVIPSLVFFLIFPILLKKGINFYLSMFSSTLIMVVCYFGMMVFIKK